ncbi:hypothetical protein N7507_008392 [Penicillium longicatenatum]|nr:hypothetical protein N7507_008392 [Penicillium longicatenatum]
MLTAVNDDGTNVKEARLSAKSAEKSAPAAEPDAADRSVTKKPVPSQHDAPDTPDTPTQVIIRQMRNGSLKWEA